MGTSRPLAPRARSVVDFYKTSCGACRYIQPGFLKLCRASAEDPTVKFLKHNCMDECAAAAFPTRAAPPLAAQSASARCAARPVVLAGDLSYGLMRAHVAAWSVGVQGLACKGRCACVPNPNPNLSDWPTRRFEEKSEVADELKIRAVPMFCFFRGGKLVDQFATRERKRIAAAINHHAGHEVLQAS